jgi:hypothetical protein
VLRASKRKNRTPLLLIERGDYANRMRGQGKIAFSDIELKNA